MLETENDAKKVLEMVYHNGFVEGYAEGYAEGIEEARKAIRKLYIILLKENRYDDFEKALNDAEYRNQLLEQYKLL